MSRRLNWRYIPLGLWSLFVLIPLYWVAITAFKDNGAVYNGARWLPWVDFHPTLAAWNDILGGSNSVYGPLFHSLVIATVSTLIALFFGSLAGYGLARRNLGAVSVVGPVRMDYPLAIAAVRQAGGELSRYVAEVYDE